MAKIKQKAIANSPYKISDWNTEWSEQLRNNYDKQLLDQLQQAVGAGAILKAPALPPLERYVLEFVRTDNDKIAVRLTRVAPVLKTLGMGVFPDIKSAVAALRIAEQNNEARVIVKSLDPTSRDQEYRLIALIGEVTK